MTSRHHLRLQHITYDFYTSPTTSPHHLRLLHITYDFNTSLTTSTHHLRLQHITYDFYTSPTTSPHHLRLLHITYDFNTSPTTSTHHLRLLHITSDFYTLLHGPHMPTGREMTRRCLEIEGKSPVTSRCYARRFLSNDSFAAILTILFSFTCTPVLVGAQL